MGDYAVVSSEKLRDGTQEWFVYCYFCELDLPSKDTDDLEKLAAEHNRRHLEELGLI